MKKLIVNQKYNEKKWKEFEQELEQAELKALGQTELKTLEQIKLKGIEQSELKDLNDNDDIRKYCEKFYELIENNPNRIKYKVGLFIGIFVYIIFTLVTIKSGFDPNLHFLIWCILGASVFDYYYKYKSPYSNYTHKVIMPLLKRRGLTHTISGMTIHEYLSGDFEKFDQYYSNHKIVGVTGNNQFEIANIYTKKEVKKGELYTPLFTGVVALIKLNKSIDTTIDITPQKIKKEENFIAIDNLEFEKFFDVYGLDEIKTISFLTPDVTTKILDLKKLVDFEFEIKIINNNLFIRFYTDALFEEVNVYLNKDIEKLTIYFEKLEKIKRIVESIAAEVESFINN